MPKEKTAVIVNPVSANGKTGKRWPEIKEAMASEGLEFDYSLTEKPYHATELTKEYLSNGYDLIISVGGDGTANEVVNGFFDNGSLIRPEASIGFISTGTGCDFRRTLDMPAEINLATRKIINSPGRLIDIGLASYESGDDFCKRLFINVAGLGLDGDTVARVNRTTKIFGGFISFLWGTLVSLILYKNRKMLIKIDGEVIYTEPVTLVSFCNGRYFGGGMKIAPKAIIDDGYFDIIIIRGLSKFNLIKSLPKVYKGTHLSHPRIVSLRGKNIEVDASVNALLNLDGEQPGNAPVEISILPNILKLRD